MHSAAFRALGVRFRLRHGYYTDAAQQGHLWWCWGRAFAAQLAFLALSGRHLKLGAALQTKETPQSHGLALSRAAVLPSVRPKVAPSDLTVLAHACRRRATPQRGSTKPCDGGCLCLCRAADGWCGRRQRRWLV